MFGLGSNNRKHESPDPYLISISSHSYFTDTVPLNIMQYDEIRVVKSATAN